MEISCSPVSWAGRTYREITALGERNGSVLIVPFGSIEQHGPHLPVATDTILSKAVAEGGAEAVSDQVPVLVTPPVWIGFSPHHLSFGGTLSGKFETLLHLVQNIIITGSKNGFNAVLVVNGHGGNIPLVGGIISTVGNRQPSIQALGVSYFDLADPFIDEIRDSETGGMSHAGEFETSLMMHLTPKLVQAGSFTAIYRDESLERAKQDMFDEGPLSVSRTFDEYTDTGTIGDPTCATAKKGETIYKGLVKELGDIVCSTHDVVSKENVGD